MAFDAVDQELKKIAEAIRKGHRMVSEDQRGGLDADVIASIVGGAFHAVGYKTRLKVVRQSDQKYFHHVFVEVFDPGWKKWVPIDPERTSPGDWEEERIQPV